MKFVLSVAMLLLAATATADSVRPADAVESYVNIRSAPDAAAEIVGRLEKGQALTLVASESGWHEVELNDGSTGFVSADWSVVMPEETVASESVDSDVSEETVDNEVTADAVQEDAPEERESVPVAEDAPVAESTGSPEAAITEETTADEDAAPDDPIDVAEDNRVAGPPGPPGPQGPPGPAGADGDGAIKGTQNYLVRFKRATVGGNSQVYDDGNRVGIGTSEPAQRLEVNGSIQIHDQSSGVAGLMITQIEGDTGYILHNKASTLTIGAGSVDRITIDRNGNVGFGISRPQHPIELPSGAYVSAGGAWTNSSSRERKENVSALGLEDALAALAELEPVAFNYRDEQAERYLGFIAEDVPELVASNDRKHLSAMDIVAVLTEVVKAQEARIRRLESRLEVREID